ncbi:hypothetical protein BDN70DRAFT_979691 [Pholiota conissans]|uniref:Uncharacterized protein n=1 Tax=Pholiota conissans TaxID=109636 RepID=A0A9P5YKS8_9AGAR|nr:hypothetical protein BDN70DRAFT_979691 [Pholiota conissans]
MTMTEHDDERGQQQGRTTADGRRRRARRLDGRRATATANEKDGMDATYTVPSIPSSSTTVCPHIREDERVWTNEQASLEGDGGQTTRQQDEGRGARRRAEARTPDRGLYIVTQDKRNDGRGWKSNRWTRVDALVLLFFLFFNEWTGVVLASIYYSNLNTKKGRIVQKRQAYLNVIHSKDRASTDS